MATARKTKEEWERLVSDFEASTLSQKLFASERSLNLSTFRNWLYKIRRRASKAQKNENTSSHGSVSDLSRKIDALEEELTRLRTDRMTYATKVDELSTQLSKFTLRAEELEARVDAIEDSLEGLGDLQDHIAEIALSSLQDVVSEQLTATVEEILPEFTDDYLNNTLVTMWENDDSLAGEEPAADRDHLQIDEISDRLDSLELTISQLKDKPPVVQRINERVLSAQRKGRSLAQARLMTRISPADLSFELRKHDFYLAEGLAAQIIQGLEERKLLVLEGVPGTGKTKLARLLASIMLPDGFGSKCTVVNVFPEATTWHSIGGLRQIEGHFIPQFGWLTEAVLTCIEARGNHWLVLDEINRGDISNLLGPVLDALEPNLVGASIDHPHLFPDQDPQRGSIPIPGNFRIIGTRNPFDTELLFNFTHALERRSRVVSIPPLLGADELSLIERLVIERRMGELGWQPERIEEFKRRFCLDFIVPELCDLIGRVRSLSQREPRYAYQGCEIGTAIVLSLADRLCRTLTDRDNISSDEARILLDSCVADMLFERPDRYGRQSIAVMLREIFDTKMGITRQKLSSI